MSCIERCPYFRGKISSIFGTQQNVLNTEVSLFQGCPLRGVPLCTHTAVRAQTDRGCRHWESGSPSTAARPGLCAGGP